MRTLLIAFLFALGAAQAAPLPHSTVAIDTPKGPVQFKVEMANDHAAQERGLMYRKSLAPDAGMLFDFHTTVMTSFWMKNTLIPLDIIFIRSDGVISSIAGNAVPMSEAQIPSSEPVRAVLEIAGGRARQLGIEPGERVHAAIFAPAR